MRDPDPETLAALALAELGRRELPAWWQLLRRSGSPAALFESSDAELLAAGATRRALAQLRKSAPDGRTKSCLERCRRLGLEVAWPGRPDYPPLLAEIADPPLALFYKGTSPVSSRPALAVVGSRRATRYGTRTAEALATEAAHAGALVVSGLAEGIDIAAHRGALACGPSLAVVAGGIDLLARGRKRAVYERLVARGTIVSEQAPGQPALRRLFPVRNRIITGMAAVTVVVEAAARSGSLISARLAAEQGRELFAVPGNIDSPVSAGTNRLLADGARPLLAAGEVLEALAIDPGADRAKGEVPKEGPEELVLSLLGAGPVSLDDLVSASGLDGARVLELLTALEIAGLAERSPSGLFGAALKLRPGGGD